MAEKMYTETVQSTVCGGLAGEKNVIRKNKWATEGFNVCLSDGNSC